MPRHTPIVPVRSLVTILLPEGLNLIIMMGSTWGLPSSFGALVSSFHIVMRPKSTKVYHYPIRLQGPD